MTDLKTVLYFFQRTVKQSKKVLQPTCNQSSKHFPSEQSIFSILAHDPTKFVSAESSLKIMQETSASVIQTH
jgi:hypothetical protein